MKLVHGQASFADCTALAVLALLCFAWVYAHVCMGGRRLLLTQVDAESTCFFIFLFRLLRTHGGHGTDGDGYALARWSRPLFADPKDSDAGVINHDADLLEAVHGEFGKVVGVGLMGVVVAPSRGVRGGKAEVHADTQGYVW